MESAPCTRRLARLLWQKAILAVRAQSSQARQSALRLRLCQAEARAREAEAKARVAEARAKEAAQKPFELLPAKAKEAAQRVPFLQRELFGALEEGQARAPSAGSAGVAGAAMKTACSDLSMTPGPSQACTSFPILRSAGVGEGSIPMSQKRMSHFGLGTLAAREWSMAADGTGSHGVSVSDEMLDMMSYDVAFATANRPTSPGARGSPEDCALRHAVATVEAQKDMIGQLLAHTLALEAQAERDQAQLKGLQDVVQRMSKSWWNSFERAFCATGRGSATPSLEALPSALGAGALLEGLEA